MGNDVAIMSEFADKVRDKIKRDFAEMIPEDAWDELVKKSVGDFIKKDLGAVVKEQLTEEVTSRLTAHFASDGWKARWAEYGHSNDASKKVRDLIRNSLPDIITALFGGAIQDFINSLKFGPQRGF